jgi:NhaP-type Na+/H+ or K+/H+ antiporter
MPRIVNKRNAPVMTTEYRKRRALERRVARWHTDRTRQFRGRHGVIALLVFSVGLVAAVLVSKRAQRTVLSTAVLFLALGVAVGTGALDLIAVTAGDPIVSRVAEVALVVVLFTDGMQAGLGDIRRAWHLPGRALLLGLPLTLVVAAVVARVVVGLPWLEALLLGAALSPTDPVLAAAIVGREEVPRRLRHLLNVESGLNDGLALPVVVVLIAVLGPSDASVGALLLEVAAGIALGVAVPWLVLWLIERRLFGVAEPYEALTATAIGLLLFSIASLTHANLFLAAFVGGVTVATISPETRRAFHQLGDAVAELMKLAALLFFGALISPRFFAEIPVSGYVFAALMLFLVRPIALGLALVRTDLSWREWLAATWFGPRGFASVVYGLLIANAGLAAGDRLFHLVALVTAASIVLHSSTDVWLARWVARADAGAEPGRRPRAA